MLQLIEYFHDINMWHLRWIIYGPLPVGEKEKGMPFADQGSNLSTLPKAGPSCFLLFSFSYFSFSSYYYFLPLRKVDHVSKRTKEKKKEKR